MKEIEELLRETMGFHTPTIGAAPVQQAVRARMSHHGLTAADAYLKVLRQSQAEWMALVESIVVPETWFFRDREPFQALTRLVQSEWLPAHPTGTLRMLSVPCSTGEEPYSMSIALLDAGLAGVAPGDRRHRHQPCGSCCRATRQLREKFVSRQGTGVS